MFVVIEGSAQPMVPCLALWFFELSEGSAQPVGHAWGPYWIRDKFQGAFSRRPFRMVDRSRVKYSLPGSAVGAKSGV